MPLAFSSRATGSVERAFCSHPRNLLSSNSDDARLGWKKNPIYRSACRRVAFARAQFDRDRSGAYNQHEPRHLSSTEEKVRGGCRRARSRPSPLARLRKAKHQLAVEGPARRACTPARDEPDACGSTVEGEDGRSSSAARRRRATSQVIGRQAARARLAHRRAGRRPNAGRRLQPKSSADAHRALYDVHGSVRASSQCPRDPDEADDRHRRRPSSPAARSLRRRSSASARSATRGALAAQQRRPRAYAGEPALHRPRSRRNAGRR